MCRSFPPSQNTENHQFNLKLAQILKTELVHLINENNIEFIITLPLIIYLLSYIIIDG